MSISRRSLLQAVGALGGLATLGGCATGTQATDQDLLEYWYYFADSDQEDYFVEHFIDGYTGSTPVRLTIKPSNTIDRLIQTALAAGKGPSLVVTPGPSQVKAYDDAGFLADLGPYAEKYGWNDLFAPWAMAASAVDGKLATLPTSYESMVFYSNPETLEKHGLTLPTDGDQFDAFCVEAQGKGLVPISAGNADYRASNEWFLTVALNHIAGPQAVYQALRGEIPWTEPVFVDTVARMSDWFTKGWFGGGVDIYFTNPTRKIYQQLANGEAASMISGTWDFANLGPYFGEAAGNEASWEWSTLPPLADGVPEEVWDLGVGQSTGINAHSANIDGAAEFLNFMTTDIDLITGAIEGINFQPPPIDLKAGDFPSGVDRRTLELYTQMPQAKTIGYTTWTFYPQKTETYMINQIERVFTGQMTAAEFCAGVQLRFASELESGQVPAVPEPGGIG